jgi:hypothetical protein
MYQRNIPQRGDALALLRSLPDRTPLVFLEPSCRSVSLQQHGKWC